MNLRIEEQQIHFMNMTSRVMHVRLTVSEGRLTIGLHTKPIGNSFELVPTGVASLPISAQIMTCITDGSLNYAISNKSGGPINFTPPFPLEPDGGPAFVFQDTDQS